MTITQRARYSRPSEASALRFVQPVFALHLTLALLAAACSPGAGPGIPGGPGGSAPRATLPPLEAGKIPVADPTAHVFLWGHPGTTQRDLALARDAGFTSIKQRFEWRNIEKNGKNQFEWQEPDRIVQAAQDAGMRIVARVDNQPRWASSRIVFPASGPGDNLRDWTDFVTALAARYKGRIHAYEIWNEPNLAREWGGQTPDPAAYTALLKASYQAIKAADPAALVISAGLSPTTESSDNARRDLDYLRGMYAAGLKGSYDLLGAHAPGFKAEPCKDPAEVAADASLTNPGDSSPAELKRVYSFRRVEDLRALMVEQGDADKQVAIMEMGWTTDPRPNSPYRWHAVSEEQQASNLAAAFQCARERMAPWLGPMTVIYIPDPTWTPGQEQFWWRITNPDGSPQPAYTALKDALRR